MLKLTPMNNEDIVYMQIIWILLHSEQYSLSSSGWQGELIQSFLKGLFHLPLSKDC